MTCSAYTARSWSPTSPEPEDDRCVNCGDPKRSHAGEDAVRPDWCQFCGWECADPDELAIHIEDCEPFDDEDGGT